MKVKKILSLLLTFVFALCGTFFRAGIQELKAFAQSAAAVWSIEVPADVESTDRILLPEGWEFSQTTSLPEGKSVTVMAVNTDPDSEEKSVDVIIKRLSDGSSSESSSVNNYGDMDDLLFPQLKKPEKSSSAPDSAETANTSVKTGSTQALPTAADDGLPITGASAGLASIAAALLAVACIIAKNNKG